MNSTVRPHPLDDTTHPMKSPRLPSNVGPSRELVAPPLADVRDSGSLVCWEHQAGELPTRLSFSVKVF